MGQIVKEQCHLRAAFGLRFVAWDETLVRRKGCACQLRVIP